MKINSEITDILKEYKINEDDGLSALLAYQFNLNVSYIPEILHKKLLLTNIIEIRDGKFIFNTPLFENTVSKLDWVKQYRELFRKVNKTRGGTLKACEDRFRKFFFENPGVTVEEVRLATKMYINSVNDPEYITSAHYFISKGKGVDKVNSLEAWIELVREKNVQDTGRISLDNVMQ